MGVIIDRYPTRSEKTKKPAIINNLFGGTKKKEITLKYVASPKKRKLSDIIANSFMFTSVGNGRMRCLINGMVINLFNIFPEKIQMQIRKRVKEIML